MWFRVKKQHENVVATGPFEFWLYSQCGTVSATCLFAFLMGRAWRVFISGSQHAAHTQYRCLKLGYEIFVRR